MLLLGRSHLRQGQSLPPPSRCVLTDSQLVSNDAQARLYVTKTEYNTAGPAHYRLLPMA